MQKATGFYFGDSYWHFSPITELIYELKDLGKVNLDWEFLCVELERDSPRGLGPRQYILSCLDDVLVRLNKQGK